MKTLALAVAVAVALTAGGCTNQPAAGEAAPSQAAQSSAAAAAPSTPATCPNGRLANGDCAGGTVAPPRLANDPVAPLVCPKILKAQGTDAIYDPDQMEPIGDQAGTSLDHDVAFSGTMLANRARLARSAKQLNPNDVEFKLDLGAAATQLATICTKAGFKQ